jgi:hypothetical protein
MEFPAMQPQIVILLIICILLAAQGYYFGFVRPPRALAWLQQATFALMLFMIIPLVLFALWKQSGAVGRLESTGVRPDPGILHAIGLATGPSTWVFKSTSTPEDLRSFYHSQEGLDGWELISSSNDMLIISNGREKMAISMSRNGNSTTTIYTMLR